MGAVAERLEITLEEAKAYLRVDTDLEDAVVMDCVDAAKAEADGYMQNDFSVNDVEIPIPSSVKMWVLKRANFHYVQRVGALTSESVSGVGSIAYNGKEFFAELDVFRKKVVKFV